MLISVVSNAAPETAASFALTQSQKEILEVLQALDIVSEEYDGLTLDLSKRSYPRRICNLFKAVCQYPRAGGQNPVL